MAESGNHAIDALSYHAISEVNHRVLNPLSERKLDRLVEILAARPPRRMLDLACGKGEMACRFAAGLVLEVTGVDVYEPFIDIAAKGAPWNSRSRTMPSSWWQKPPRTAGHPRMRSTLSVASARPGSAAGSPERSN